HIAATDDTYRRISIAAFPAVQPLFSSRQATLPAHAAVQPLFSSPRAPASTTTQSTGFVNTAARSSAGTGPNPAASTTNTCGTTKTTKPQHPPPSRPSGRGPTVAPAPPRQLRAANTPRYHLPLTYGCSADSSHAVFPCRDTDRPDQHR